ncbi:hypothetical protein GCM10020221_05770 [Streptomyces thioluteus]|uniref:Uncharacterized protein n=1 Tax=Streptomyces thioluteus TaxID=66431 RepID=A0ABN3WE93_STRTU
MDVGRAPCGGVHRVGAGADRGEAVAALVVGEAAARAGEVGVQRGGVAVGGVGVSARRVGLPYLDQLAADGAAAAVEYPAADGDAFAQRLPGVLPRQVVVEGADRGRAEDRAGQLGRLRVAGEEHGRVVRLPPGNSGVGNRHGWCLPLPVGRQTNGTSVGSPA